LSIFNVLIDYHFVIKELRSFLGLANYYKRFVKYFSTIAAPLYEKTSDKRLTWTKDCERAFHTLRSYLAGEQVLTLPDFEKPFKLETDASNIGIGAVFSQVIRGKDHPIAYFSQHL
jgi:hypothetical protein